MFSRRKSSLTPARARFHTPALISIPVPVIAHDNDDKIIDQLSHARTPTHFHVPTPAPVPTTTSTPVPVPVPVTDPVTLHLHDDDDSIASIAFNYIECNKPLVDLYGSNKSFEKVLAISLALSSFNPSMREKIGVFWLDESHFALRTKNFSKTYGITVSGMNKNFQFHHIVQVGVMKREDLSEFEEKKGWKIMKDETNEFISSKVTIGCQNLLKFEPSCNIKNKKETNATTINIEPELKLENIDEINFEPELIHENNEEINFEPEINFCSFLDESENEINYLDGIDDDDYSLKFW